jgi:hypothetical protein
MRSHRGHEEQEPQMSKRAIKVWRYSDADDAGARVRL